MKKVVFIFLISLSAFAATDSFSQAQTVEELESAGLRHYKNAHFKAIPAKNRAMADKEFARAEKAFQKAIKKKPTRLRPYLHLGRTYSAQKKYAAAARTYRSALVIAPRHKRLYLRLASVLEKKGDYRGAINALDTLRAMETDERAIRIIDDLISQMEMRATGSDSDKSQSGSLP